MSGQLFTNAGDCQAGAEPFAGQIEALATRYHKLTDNSRSDDMLQAIARSPHGLEFRLRMAGDPAGRILVSFLNEWAAAPQRALHTVSPPSPVRTHRMKPLMVYLAKELRELSITN